MMMLRYFSICFHVPLSNRDVSTYGYLICGFSKLCSDRQSSIFWPDRLSSIFQLSPHSLTVLKEMLRRQIYGLISSYGVSNMSIAMKLSMNNMHAMKYEYFLNY